MLRARLPKLTQETITSAEWIVSISDDGWFGRSLAMYQQLQMSQVYRCKWGRFQVVSNNDGLSSIIDFDGNIIASLPAFSAGILEETVYPVTGTTPWVYYGDLPVLLFCLLAVLWIPLSAFTQKKMANIFEKLGAVKLHRPAFHYSLLFSI